jgi:hypothetical protein
MEKVYGKKIVEILINTKVSMCKIKNKGLGFIYGKMETCIKALFWET